MTEFQELIKNFDRIRDYMRQFYVYGFKARNDFDLKSTRTYDNERRRIESWLSDFTTSDYTSRGKHVYINVDSKTISQNPLYAAWKSKSFTDNDILLHFFILDLMSVSDKGFTAGQLSDQISKVYGAVFDSQTVRLKLKEYENLGILTSHKEGKALSYRISPPLSIDQSMYPDVWDHFMAAVKFFQEAAPFGFIGSAILDQHNLFNDLFQFKHHFIVHTLEDNILAEILAGIQKQCVISTEHKSTKSGQLSILKGIPLKIFVSRQTGRRYLCMYLPERRRFNCVRLDGITKVKVLEPYEYYEPLKKKLEENKRKCWGVSFGGANTRLEEICIKFYIDEEKEPHILNRLFREGRGGEVLKIREHEYLYTGCFFDTNEMLSWIKTFTGRILDIQGTNQLVIAKVTRDLETMYQMYGGDEDGTL